MLRSLRLLFLYALLFWERFAWWWAGAVLRYRTPKPPGRRFLPEIGDGVNGRVVSLRPEVRIVGGRRRRG